MTRYSIEFKEAAVKKMMPPNAVSMREVSHAKLSRLIRRGSISEGETKQYRAKMHTKGLTNPYIEITSGSNGHKHRRYIQFGELLDTPVPGYFDQFGLSKTATIPWF